MKQATKIRLNALQRRLQHGESPDDWPPRVVVRWPDWEDRPVGDDDEDAGALHIRLRWGDDHECD